MIDEALFRDKDEGIHRVRRATLQAQGMEPKTEWTIETSDSRIVAPVRAFGSKEEMDMVLAVEGKKVGKLVDSVAQLIERMDWDEHQEFPGGTLQFDWFDIEDLEEGDSE